MKKKLVTQISYCNECSNLMPPIVYGRFYSVVDGQSHSFCGKIGLNSGELFLPDRFINPNIEIPDWCPLEDSE